MLRLDENLPLPADGSVMLTRSTRLERRMFTELSGCSKHSVRSSWQKKTRTPAE